MIHIFVVSSNVIVRPLLSTSESGRARDRTQEHSRDLEDEGSGVEWSEER